MELDIQINPACIGWPQLRDEVLRARDEGFRAAWVYDHLAGRSLSGDSMLECFTTLGALAATTTGIDLGTMVVNMTLREPAVVVAAAASVQQISDRPFLLGLGAGAGPDSPWAAELHAAGVSPPERLADRHARVARTLDLCRRTWDPDRPDELATFALPSPVPRCLVGVNSVALARLAGGRADGINLWWHHPRRDAFLAAAEAERPAGAGPFLRTAWVTEEPGLLAADHPIRCGAEAAGFDRLIVLRRVEGM